MKSAVMPFLRRHRILAVIPLVLSAAATGCGGGHDALEKELGELRAEISKLRATQASMGERLDTIDTQDRAKMGASAASGGRVASVPPPLAVPRDGDRPELDTVKLAPPNEGDGDVDNDPSRPVVRAVGSGDRRETLNNRSIATRPGKKGITSAKKTDGAAVKQ